MNTIGFDLQQVHQNRHREPESMRCCQCVTLCGAAVVSSGPAMELPGAVSMMSES